MDKEKSAGGVFSKDGKLALVRVKNLEGQKVWTFPKGHIEKNETPKRAALREVWEETGWECRILRPLLVARYHFKRKGRPVSKTVRWYEMEPVVRSGKPAPQEILATRWAAVAAAEKLLRYESDLKVLKVWQKYKKPNRRLMTKNYEAEKGTVPFFHQKTSPQS